MLSAFYNALALAFEQVWELQNNKITERVISPETFGLQSRKLSSVAGGKPQENAQLILDLLNNQLDPETSPIENFVVMNAAALLVVSGRASDEKEGVKMARSAIANGKALQALNEYRKQSQNALREEEDDDNARA